MRNLIVLTIFSLTVLFSGGPVKAHSGRTNSSGCHNCNVGACAGTYHCHNGGPAYDPPAYDDPPPVYDPPEPTATLKPWPTWTTAPLPTATLEPTEIPTNTPEPTQEVLGAETEISPTPAVAGTKEASPLGGFLTLLLFGGGYWLWKKRKPDQTPPTQV